MLSPAMVRLVLDMHRSGSTILAIAKTLNLHIEEVANVIATHG